ncbi:BaiN/RdsA family NAD(P)/FAD-dependent oxidoreductase [Nonlabens xiamenensis]|uniref:NAD(P)/FAD-dependent oxidoreductase n=1 Tax=Nonlabens xiamenensis TaxID=2341043 RepID=UPI000F613146|nr:NAD(P)/FAD-dependent oxidoreductase [Nonlabens xiamenensis]
MRQPEHFDVIIIGGGAAGFFTAINLAEQCPKLSIVILERGKQTLQKVRISGGGRCNVTHAEFEPKSLTDNYPRGQKELLGPFHKFMTGDTVNWFEEHGVELKIETDGRMFPSSNSSQTIVDCFLDTAAALDIQIKTSENVTAISRVDQHWQVNTTTQSYTSRELVVTAGSSPKIWKLMQQQGHNIVDAVPSLFTFNSLDASIKSLAGIAVEARIEILALGLESEGPLLITHWGFSGPAVLKMSAWGARELNDINYKFDLVINWLGYINHEECLEQLLGMRQTTKKNLGNAHPFDLPKRLWQYLVASQLDSEKNWKDCSNNELEQLASLLTASSFPIEGKSTFKEEFVTAGGVDLKEIDFKTFASRKQENLYLAGEVLNIDAITGGFNFQNAWTGGWLIAQAIASKSQMT